MKFFRQHGGERNSNRAAQKGPVGRRCCRGHRKNFERAMNRGNSDRLAGIEANLTSIERKMRDVVKGEMETTHDRFCRCNLSSNDFSALTRNLKEIKQNGWAPALFRGLIQRSEHWGEVAKNPANYGSLLAEHKTLDPDKVPIFVDAGKTRVLELTPFALHGLLSKQTQEGAGAPIVGAGVLLWLTYRTVAASWEVVSQDKRPHVGLARFRGDPTGGKRGDPLRIPHAA